jgi:hypothetical protein
MPIQDDDVDIRWLRYCAGRDWGSLRPLRARSHNRKRGNDQHYRSNRVRHLRERWPWELCDALASHDRPRRERQECDQHGESKRVEVGQNQNQGARQNRPHVSAAEEHAEGGLDDQHRQYTDNQRSDKRVPGCGRLGKDVQDDGDERERRIQG